MEGHHLPIQHNKCACQFQCQRTLYVVHVHTELMPCPQLPTEVLLTVTYRELHLGSWRVPICPAQLRHLFHRNPHKDFGWVGSTCHPSATGWSSQQGFLRNPIADPKRDGSWRPWTSKASGSSLNQSRNRPGSCCSTENTCLLTATWT